MVNAPGFSNIYYSFDDFIKTVYRDKYGDDAEIEAYFNDESNSYMPY